MVRQFGESPILLHLGMQKVLVDRGEFTCQLLVEKLENIGIALHCCSSNTAGLVECHWLSNALQSSPGEGVKATVWRSIPACPMDLSSGSTLSLTCIAPT